MILRMERCRYLAILQAEGGAVGAVVDGEVLLMNTDCGALVFQSTIRFSISRCSDYTDSNSIGISLMKTTHSFEIGSVNATKILS